MQGALWKYKETFDETWSQFSIQSKERKNIQIYRNWPLLHIQLIKFPNDHGSLLLYSEFVCRYKNLPREVQRLFSKKIYIRGFMSVKSALIVKNVLNPPLPLSSRWHFVQTGVLSLLSSLIEKKIVFILTLHIAHHSKELERIKSIVGNQVFVVLVLYLEKSLKFDFLFKKNTIFEMCATPGNNLDRILWRPLELLLHPPLALTQTTFKTIVTITCFRCTSPPWINLFPQPWQSQPAVPLPNLLSLQIVCGQHILTASTLARY